MIPYYLFFSFFGLSASLDYARQDEWLIKLKTGLFISGFFLILYFVGFRYKLGSDWLSYITMYNDALSLKQLFQADNLSFSSDFTEPGFKIFTSLCKDLGISYVFWVFLMTLFNTISLFYFILKSPIRKKTVFLAMLLILTTFYEFDILRQSMAFHIVLLAFIGKQNFWKTMFYTILAMTFHYTAFLFLIFYLFNKINFSERKIYLIGLFYLVSLFISIPLITSFLQLLAPIVGGTLSAVLSKAANLVQGFGFQRTVSFTSLLNLMFLALLASRINKINLKPIELTLIKAFLFYIIINIFLKEVQEVADRFSYYFNIGIAFMFCLLEDFIKIKERKLLLLGVPVIFIMMRLTLHFRDQAIWYGQTPYRNYFFTEDSDEAIINNRYNMMQGIKSNENERKGD